MAGLPTTIYDRPSLAVSNLLEGDLAATGQSLLAPESLGPEKLTPLHKKIFGKLRDMSKQNPMLSAIMKVATDPMVILGLFLSWKFPIAAADKMFKIGKRFAGYGHTPKVLEGLFGRAERIFAGTGIPNLMLKAGVGKDAFIKKWSTTKVEPWLKKFVKDNGGRAMTQAESELLGNKLLRLDRSGWMLDKAGTAMPPLIAKRIKLSGPLQALHDKLVKFFPQMRDEVIVPMQKSPAGMAALREFKPQIEEKVASFTKKLKMSGATEWRIPEMAKKYKETLEAQLLRSRKHKAALYARGALEQGGVMDHTAATYFPHTLKKTPELSREYANLAKDALEGNPQALARMEQMSSQGMVSGHIKPRFGVLVPDVEAIEALGLPINQDALTKMRAVVAGRASQVTSEADKLLFNIKAEFAKSPEMPVQKALDSVRIAMRKRGVMLSETNTKVRAAMGEFSAGNFPGFHEGMLSAVRESAAIKRVYSSDAIPVLHNYIGSLATPYVWSVAPIGEGYKNLSAKMPLGEAIVKETSRLGSSISRRMMNTDYIPILKGNLAQHQVDGMLRWSNMKLRAVSWLQGKESAIAKAIPKGMRDRLVNMITQERGKFSYLNSGGKLAGYFYYSALGFNPASAFQNLLQPVITTMPLVGAKAYWKGLNNTVSKLSGPKGYFAMRAKGLDAEAAISKVFPEYAGSHLGQAPLSQSILRDALEGMWSQAASKMPQGLYSPGSSAGLRAIKESAMKMFTGSEMFNRLATFEAGLAKAKIDTASKAAKGWLGLSRKQLVDAQHKFAASVVRATQFPAGPGQMPRALLKLSAPWRQFLYFPIRYAGFLGESTLYGGGASRNWGTIGRALAASGVAKHAAQGVLGADISHSLMFGALPLPQYEDSPFYPFPLVPPVASLMGSGAAALATGDTRHLSRSASLLVPAGVAARRAYRTLAPKYAKYGQRTPDGKIPVFGDNQALVGNFTPMQLWMRAAGIKPVQATTEHAMTRYLLKHRDEIREARRQYVEALAAGNPEQAQRIQDAFKRQYPSLGPIQVKKSDLRAVEDRRMMTRLQRILKTLPSQYRPMFQNMVNTAMAGQTGNMFGGGYAPPAGMPSLMQAVQRGEGAYGSASPGGEALTTPYGAPASGFGAAYAGFGL